MLFRAVAPKEMRGADIADHVGRLELRAQTVGEAAQLARMFSKLVGGKLPASTVATGVVAKPRRKRRS